MYQTVVVGIGVGYVCVIAYLANAHVHDFGLRKERFISSIKSLIVLSLGIGLLLVAFGIGNIRIGVFPEMLQGITSYGNIIGLLIYVFISVPLQEVIFRGYVIWRLTSISNNQSHIVWISAVVFALMHVPFGNWYVVGVALIFGLWSSKVYLRDRNIYAIMICHALIGGAEIIRQILLS